MVCENCLYYRICFERRGICSEFKTLEDIANDVKRINENFKETSTRPKDGDKDD